MFRIEQITTLDMMNELACHFVLQRTEALKRQSIGESTRETNPERRKPTDDATVRLPNADR
jgi:hypothetical protein